MAKEQRANISDFLWGRTQTKTLTSCLQPHRGLIVLGTGQLVLALCCPHGSWQVRGPGMYWGPLTCYQDQVCGGELSLHSQPHKELGENIWGCVSLCCSHQWNIFQLHIMKGQCQVVTDTSRFSTCQSTTALLFIQRTLKFCLVVKKETLHHYSTVML